MAGQDIPTNTGKQYDIAVIDATREWPQGRPTPDIPMPLLTLNGTMASGGVSPLRQKHDALIKGLEDLASALDQDGLEEPTQAIRLLLFITK